MVVPSPAVTFTVTVRVWPGVNSTWEPGLALSSSVGVIDTLAPGACTVTNAALPGAIAV